MAGSVADQLKLHHIPGKAEGVKNQSFYNNAGEYMGGCAILRMDETLCSLQIGEWLADKINRFGDQKVLAVLEALDEKDFK